MLSETLPSIGSILAGAFFGISWLLWIDGVSFAGIQYERGVDGAYWIPGILQTLSLLMINLISWEVVGGDGAFDDSGGIAARIWVFSSFVFAFGGLIGAIWILVQEINAPSWEQGSVEPAFRGLLQNLFIFASSLLFRLSRLKSDS
ncbi:MAG: hypothetical protein SGPRY_013107 [Prymnesium sp.]